MNYFCWQGGYQKTGNIGNMAFSQSRLTLYPVTGNKPQKLETLETYIILNWKHFGYTIKSRINKYLIIIIMETFWIQRKLALLKTLCFHVSNK